MVRSPLSDSTRIQVRMTLDTRFQMTPHFSIQVEVLESKKANDFAWTVQVGIKMFKNWIEQNVRDSIQIFIMPPWRQHSYISLSIDSSPQNSCNERYCGHSRGGLIIKSSPQSNLNCNHYFSNSNKGEIRLNNIAVKSFHSLCGTFHTNHGGRLVPTHEPVCPKQIKIIVWSTNGSWPGANLKFGHGRQSNLGDSVNSG